MAKPRASRKSKSTALVPSTAMPGVSAPNDMGQQLMATNEPLIGPMFTPRVQDRRSLYRPPWTASQIIEALEAVEHGDMGPQADLAEWMSDRDAAYGGFRQTRILAAAKLPWTIMPADDSPLAKEVADFCRAEILSITNFPHAHRDMFTAAGPGMAALWIDWQKGGRRHNGQAPKSDYRIDGIHYINPKRYRFHWAEEKFLILPDWGFGKALELGLMNPLNGPTTYSALMNAGLGVEPPPWKCIIHRSRVRSGHPGKVGLDRVSAFHVYLRVHAMKGVAVYCDVYGMPFRIAKYPPNMPDHEKAFLAEQMEHLGTDASAIVSNVVEFEFLEASRNSGRSVPYFDVLKDSERQMQLAWLGQDQTNTHNDAGGRTQVAEGGAPIRQDLAEADCIDAQTTYNVQLLKPIVGFSHYGWDVANTLCPTLKIAYEQADDYVAMATVDEIVYTKLKLKVTQGMLAARYKRELPKSVDPEELIDYTPPAPSFGNNLTDPQPVIPPITKPPKKKAMLINAALFRSNFAAEMAGDSTAYSYASTQVNLTGSVADQVLAMAADIPDDALAPKGREDTPHVTVKYGIDPAVTIDELRPIVGPRAAGSLTLGATAFFAAPEYDVVFITVDSPDLVALNQAIVDGVKTTDTTPNYVPHLTLAYVESGRGHEFAGNGAMNGVVYPFTSVMFSDTAGNLTKIQAIRGHVRVTAPKPGTKLADLAPGTGTWYEAERNWYSSVGRKLLAAGSLDDYELERLNLELEFAAAVAEASKPPGQAAIDELTERAIERAGPIYSALADQAKKIALNAPSLEAIPDLLRAAFADLDTTDLQRLTRRTLFVSRLHGRATAKRTLPTS